MLIKNKKIKKLSQVIESIKVTKIKMKEIVLIKWFINLVKEKETSIMNISGTPVMTSTTI